MMKRGQFWLMAIVLVYLAIVTMFFYVRSADRSSINLFEPNLDLEFQNLVNAINVRNNWLKSTGNDWYDLAWQYRRKIEITQNGTPAEIPTGIEAGKVGNCIADFRVVNLTNSEIQANVSATTAPGCNITIGVSTTPFTFYVYYGNPSASTPSYRQGTAQQGTEVTATLGSEMEVPTRGLCTHLNSIYPRLGMQLNCSLANVTCPAPRTQANISIQLQSTGFKFNGTIFPQSCTA